MVLANGSVTHCCYDYEGSQAIGQVDGESLEAMLSGRRLAEIADAFDRHDLSSLPRCAECFRLEREVPSIPAFVYRLARFLPFKDRLKRWFL